MNTLLKKNITARYLLIFLVLVLVQAAPSTVQGKAIENTLDGSTPAGPLAPEESMQISLRSQLGGASYAVAVSGNYAYVGIGPRIVVLDIYDPTKPQEIAKTEVLPGVVEDIAISGYFAYIADSEGGLRVFDIYYPNSPKEIGFYDTPGSAYGVTIDAGYAYVADYLSGLQILDISSPDNPVLVGYYDTPGYACKVAVAGKYAYVADYAAGLRIINIGDPANPTGVGFYDTAGYARDVAVSGSYAYVADYTDGLRIINVSNPAAPAEVTYYDTGGNAYALALSGNYAFIADGGNGLLILNLATPSPPTVAGFYNTPGFSYNLVVSGSYAYVADFYTGMRIIDIAKPEAASEVACYDTPGYAQDIVVSGNYAYIADGTAGLRIVNISSPTNPVMVGFYDTPGYAYGVAVSGNYAYVADYNYGLRIINISNPSMPWEAASYDPAGFMQDVTISGNYAYIADNEAGLIIIDISNPLSPSQVGANNSPVYAYGIAISGNYAYFADGSYGLRIFDVSSKTAPAQVALFDTPGYVNGIVISGSYAYAADGGYGLRIINISNPANPANAGSYDTPGSAEGVAISGSYAYIADYSSGLQVINISNPATPYIVGSYDTSGMSNDVAVSNSTVYLADGPAGLYILLACLLPETPILVTPANAASTNDNTPYFDWNTANFASHYLLEVDDSNTFSSPALASTLTTDYFTPSSPLSDNLYYWRVRGYNLASGCSVSSTPSAAWTFTIDTMPPPVPGLSTPSNGSSTIDTTPTFTWNTSSGAVLYQVQVDNDSNFSSTLYDQTTASTSFTPGVGVSPGIYYWHVRAKDSVGNWSSYSSSWTVTVLACNTPGIPVLAAPANGSTTNDNTPLFDWNTASEATEYQVQVDDNSGFTSTAIDLTTTSTDYTAISALTDTTYYWRVRGHNTANGCNVYGSYSASWTVTIDATPPPVPALTAPSNGSSTTDTTPTFSWNISSGAANYQIQVDNNSNFSSPEIDQTTSGTGYTPVSTLPPGIYYWHVRAQDSVGNWSAYSSSWTVTLVVCNVPGTPILVAPTNGSTTNNNAPLFDWNTASDATEYHFQLDDNSDFSSPSVSISVIDTYYSPGTYSDKTYYWRVRGHNTASGCDIYGSFSTTWTVTIDTTPPPVPTLSSPSNGSSSTDTTPTFNWNASGGAVNYQIQVDNTSGFLSPEIDQTTNGITYTPATALLSGTYSWHVRAQDSAGNWSSYSSEWVVSIITCNPPGIPVLVSPGDGSSTNDSTPLFDWDVTGGATEYQIQVDDYSDFTSPVVDLTTTATAQTPASALPNGTYYWHVRAHNTASGCNLYGPYSASWIVTIDTNITYSVYLPLTIREYRYYFEGPNEVEHNDTKDTANGPIRSGQNYTGTFDDNSDYFSFQTSTTGTISVILDYTGSDVSVQLYTATMESKGYAPGPLTHLVIISDPLPAGWYYVRIYTASPGPGSYTLKVTYP